LKGGYGRFLKGKHACLRQAVCLRQTAKTSFTPTPKGIGVIELLSVSFGNRPRSLFNNSVHHLTRKRKNWTKSPQNILHHRRGELCSPAKSPQKKQNSRELNHRSFLFCNNSLWGMICTLSLKRECNFSEGKLPDILWHRYLHGVDAREVLCVAFFQESAYLS